MKVEIESNGVWYHGSNVIFDVLRKGSTVTQWRALAEAFSHKPTELGYDDNGIITHNGKRKRIFIYNWWTDHSGSWYLSSSGKNNR